MATDSVRLRQSKHVFNREGNINNLISALPRHALYCVWITTGDPRRPLECAWIDPEFRSFQFMDIQQTTETDPKPRRRLFAKAASG